MSRFDRRGRYAQWYNLEDEQTISSATPNQFNTNLLESGATQSPSKGSIARNQFTSAINGKGEAVTPKVTNQLQINPTEGMNNIWSDLGKSNLDISWGKGMNLDLKIGGGEGKFLGMGEGGWNTTSAVIGGIKKIADMMNKPKPSFKTSNPSSNASKDVEGGPAAAAQAAARLEDYYRSLPQ